MENSSDPHTSTELDRPSGIAVGREPATVRILDEMRAYAPAARVDELIRMGRKPGEFPAPQS